MRSRFLHPGFFTDEKLARLSVRARLVFAGLWLIADREGRLLDNEKMISGLILPFSHHSCRRELADLAAAGRILRYAIADTHVIQIVNFAKHQHVHPKEKPSALPDLAGKFPGSARENHRLDPSASTSTSTSTSTKNKEKTPPASSLCSTEVHPNGGGHQAPRRRAPAAAQGRAAPHVDRDGLTPDQKALLRQYGFGATLK